MGETRMTEERFAPVGELELCYDEIGPPDGEPMLMVMGLGTQMVGWDERLCARLAEHGFRVIRFDNRDIGRSTKLESAGMPLKPAMLLGLGEPAYRLRDLAADAAGLLDHLEIDSAHVVGASMGGMIAQTLAIEEPQRVRSLTSLMSGPGSRWSAMPRLRALGTLLQRTPRNREAFIEMAVKTFSVIGSPGFKRDEERLRERAALSWERGHHPAGVARQLHAVTASPDRSRELRKVTAPTVVIHGSDDPLVRLTAGRATARAIRDARLVVIDGMGHDLAPGTWPQIVDAIVDNAGRRSSNRLDQPSRPATASSAA